MVATAGTRFELHYQDPAAAVGWLGRVFGLEPELLVYDPDGKLAFGRVDGPVALVPAGPGRPGPSAAGGVSTQTVNVILAEDVDAHCERARSEGARVLIEPRDEFYGERNYVAADLEGHLWCFSQRVSDGGPPPEGWRVELLKARASS
jgi:uncharacterized glyoxalase superfamily protein PhnB